MHSRKTFQCKHDFWIKCKNYFCILCKNDFCIKCKQLLTNKSDQICLLCYFAFRYLSWKVLPLATPSRQCRLYLKHYFLPKMKILNISDFFRDPTLLYSKVYQSQLIVHQRFHWKANVRAHSINGPSLQYPSHSSVRVRTLHFAFFIYEDLGGQIPPKGHHCPIMQHDNTALPLVQWNFLTIFGMPRTLLQITCPF